mmetsp:Transcript_31487/g.57209  ORF Transcript_31487/g.57209 Transcript_31487/m.57209 type:complete len:509 (-) Transcript_31487:81-1607(-)
MQDGTHAWDQPDMVGVAISSSEESEYEPCDPCEGRCQSLLAVGVIVLGLLKMILVAPFALAILWLGSAVTICLGCVVCTCTCPMMMLRSLAFQFHQGVHNPCAFICALLLEVLSLLIPFIISIILIACLILGAPLFALVKPVLDTWTAWKWGKVWYLPDLLWPKVDISETASLTKRKPSAKAWGLSDARSDAFNGTLGVLAEGAVLSVVMGATLVTLCPALSETCVHRQLKSNKKKRYRCAYCDEKSSRCVKDEFGQWVCQSCADPGALELESFVQELKDVGCAAIEAGLISKTECQDIEPFLILGLPGLVLLRSVVQTCEEDEDPELIEKLLQFLSKTYRDQGEGLMEFWGVDGYIYEFDESFDKATAAWLDAKAALDEAGFLDSDSEDEADEPQKGAADNWWTLWCRSTGKGRETEHVSEYAIFEAWILFGERAETEGLQARAKHFLSAYDDLPEDRKVALNKAASKIRSVALLISKTPSIQPRLMTVMQELGEGQEAQASGCCCY